MLIPQQVDALKDRIAKLRAARVTYTIDPSDETREATLLAWGQVCGVAARCGYSAPGDGPVIAWFQRQIGEPVDV